MSSDGLSSLDFPGFPDSVNIAYWAAIPKSVCASLKNTCLGVYPRPPKSLWSRPDGPDAASWAASMSGIWEALVCEKLSEF